MAGGRRAAWAREVGHGSTAMIERVYGHLGTIRQRGGVPEYQVATAISPGAFLTLFPTLWTSDSRPNDPARGTQSQAGPFVVRMGGEGLEPPTSGM